MISRAGFGDLSDILRLEQVCFSDDAWSVLDVIWTLTSRSTIRCKAITEAGLCGFAAAEFDRDKANTGWIITLGVFPQYRNQGIGTALLRACESKLATPQMRLCVNTNNSDAIHLYQRAGYAEVGLWPGYYASGCDALVMEKNG